MLLNKSAINKTAINATAAMTGITYPQQIIATVRQKVGFGCPEHTIATLTQSVKLRSTFEGSLGVLRQKVSSKYISGTVAILRQRVSNNEIRSFFERYGFDVNIAIDEYVIDTTTPSWENGLCDEFKIEARAGQSRTFTFSIIPPKGPINPEEFQGKSITCLIKGESDSTFLPVFTGFIDVPIVNFMQRKITFVCTDRRNDRIIQSVGNRNFEFGFYSEAVFGKSTDKSEELDKRLQTIPYDYDYDNYGNDTLVPWLPKVTPDYVFNNEIAYKNIDVSYTNRAKTLNSMNMNIKYSYQRLHQQTCQFNWFGFDDFLQDYWSAGRPSFPSKSTITGAANGSNWKTVGGVFNFTDLWPAQGFSAGSGVITWQPNLVQKTYKGVTKFSGYQKDSLGQYVTFGSPPKLVPVYEPVLDVNGKQAMEVIQEIITDTSSGLCRGASWSSALRFAQTVTESYNINVTAPQSTNKFGIIDSYEEVSIQDTYDTSSWENSISVTNTLDPFYINQKQRYAQLTSAFVCAYYKAKTSLLKLHRDVVVTFQCHTPFPAIDLKHTVELDMDETRFGSSRFLHAIGKVGSFTHYINFSTEQRYTEIQLFLSRAEGSASNSPLVIVRPEEDPTYIGESFSAVLETHLGLNPDPAVTPGAENWTGFVGNSILDRTAVTDSYRTDFQEGFIVNFPAIPENIRSEIEYAIDNDYTIIIPNDFLEEGF